MTVCVKHLTAREVNIDFMAWFASNYIPFEGAMSRRVIDVLLKYSIPEKYLDNTLRRRLHLDAAKQQHKCVDAYNFLIAENPNAVLNAVWPAYFKHRMEEMENTNEPICAFLSKLRNHTNGSWYVVPRKTAAQRAQRQKNYVPKATLMLYFQKYCATTGRRVGWDDTQWVTAMDKFGLWQDTRRLEYTKSPESMPETIEREYVFGILDPRQTNQPGGGVQQEIDDLDDDAEFNNINMDIETSLTINGMTMGEVVNMNDPDGVLRGLEGAITPMTVRWLWKHGTIDREGGRSEDYVSAIMGMIADSGISDQIKTLLDNPAQRRRRR